jgi:hypothetical protein
VAQGLLGGSPTAGQDATRKYSEISRANNQSKYSNARKEIFLHLPLKVLPFLHNSKNPAHLDELFKSDNMENWFDASCSERHVQVQAFCAPGFKNPGEWSELRKRLEALHSPHLGVNELLYLDFETSLNLMMQVRLYMTIKNSEHETLMQRFRAKYSEEFSKKNTEF